MTNTPKPRSSTLFPRANALSISLKITATTASAALGARCGLASAIFRTSSERTIRFPLISHRHEVSFAGINRPRDLFVPRTASGPQAICHAIMQTVPQPEPDRRTCRFGLIRGSTVGGRGACATAGSRRSGTSRRQPRSPLVAWQSLLLRERAATSGLCETRDGGDDEQDGHRANWFQRP